jgi:hypothetical protein
MMKILIIYLPFSIFGLFGIPLFFSVLVNIENDATTKLTNYGFAIIAALSALCFSWNRSVATDTDLQDFTRVQGQRSLLIAIIFLICSGIKYFMVSIAALPFLYPNIVIRACQLILFPLVSTAFLFLLSVAFWILFRIALRLWEEFDFTKKWPG